MSSVTRVQKEKKDECLKEMWEAILFFGGLALFVITLVGMMEMATVRHPSEHTLHATKERNADEQQQLHTAR